MMIKLVKKAERDGKPGIELPVYTCTHIQRFIPDDGSGIFITLCNPGPGSPAEVVLPRDGERVFLLNDEGDTFDSHRWPPEPRDKPKFQPSRMANTGGRQ